MFKKLLLAIALFSGIAISSKAQQYTVLLNPIDSNTTGGDTYVAMYDYVTNTTTDSIALTWNIVYNNLPSGWTNVGLCDNINCFGDVFTLNGGAHTTKKFGVNGICQFTEEIIAPVSAANGTGTVKVRTQTTKFGNIDTLGQVDTIVYNLNKTALTSITTINNSDVRVVISPNPANNILNVFTDKTLNASKISVVSITGQTAYTTTLSKSSSQTTPINIAALAKGTYMVNVADNKGQIITARKFIKD